MTENTTGPDSATVAKTAVHEPLLTWIWRDYLRARRGRFFLGMILLAIEGSMLGALSYLIRPMFDEVFVAGDRGAVGWVAGAIFAVFAIRALSAFCNKLLVQGAGLLVIADMQRDLVSHLLTLDSSYFNKNPPGTLMERVRGDTAAANQAWSSVLSVAARDVVSVIVLLAVALSVDVVWTLVVLAAVPLLLGPAIIILKYIRKATMAAREMAGRLTVRLDEMFHGINTIKLNTSEHLEVARFSTTLDGYIRQELRARSGRAGLPSITDIIAGLGFAGVVVYGGNEIIDGEKTVGEFMSFFTAIAFLFEPLRRVANFAGTWQTARTSLDRVREVLRAAPTILSPAAPSTLNITPAQADVVFDDVSLSYSAEPALKGTSFVAKAGETTALVGASGAGKSTLFNVLTRLIDPDSGVVRVGDVSSREMSLADLRRLFSVVTQDAPMFDESLRSNIQMAEDGVTDAQFAAALEAAHLTEFVNDLSEGLNTRVGPRGSQLSGGQRQRVAIARALLRNAPILLLDEATSALDAESEARVQEALDKLSEERTTLVIAHRLSTIRRADKIVVMDKGRVVDEGRHDELLARGGVYANLYELQFREG